MAINTPPAALNTLELPRQLVAILTFEPVLEQVKTARKKNSPTDSGEGPRKKRARTVKEALVAEQAEPKLKLLPSLNEVIDKQRQGYGGRELIRSQVERGREVGQRYLDTHQLAAPLLPWAAVEFTVYFADYRQHDVHNLYCKGILDGLGEWIKTGRYARDKRAGAGYWPDDSRVIELRISSGGVDLERPRVELKIYRLWLTLSEEATLLASARDAQKRVRPA